MPINTARCIISFCMKSRINSMESWLLINGILVNQSLHHFKSKRRILKRFADSTIVWCQIRQQSSSNPIVKPDCKCCLYRLVRQCKQAEGILYHYWKSYDQSCDCQLTSLMSLILVPPFPMREPHWLAGMTSRKLIGGSTVLGVVWEFTSCIMKSRIYLVSHIWHVTYLIRHRSDTLHIWHITYLIRHRSDTSQVWHVTDLTRYISDTLHIWYVTYLTRHISDTSHIWYVTYMIRKRSDMSHIWYVRDLTCHIYDT